MDGFKRPIKKGIVAQIAKPNLPSANGGEGNGCKQAMPTPVELSQVSDVIKDEQAGSVFSQQILDSSREPRLSRPRWALPLAILAGVLLIAIVSGLGWYQQQLQPASLTDKTAQYVEIGNGASLSYVANHLQQRGLIRNALAFQLYAHLSHQQGSLKAGTCRLIPTETPSDILSKIIAGCHDYTSITFYPGATIEKSLYQPTTMYVKYVLAKAGYSDQQINDALTAEYDSPLFADKPAHTTLEGYVFGQTYYIDKGMTAGQVLEQSFVEMEKVVTQDDLVAKFKTQGLNLYQGITLASIVQRELNCEDKPTEARKATCYGYQRQIAQVFLTRLQEGMALGSDVTFIYAADQMGVTPSPDLDSPYNTRKNTGLPPGPIGAPGELALKAVANPTTTDYLYFLAGDDGLIYFATTEAEHEANISNHCQQLCSEF